MTCISEKQGSNPGQKERTGYEGNDHERQLDHLSKMVYDVVSWIFFNQIICPFDINCHILLTYSYLYFIILLMSIEPIVMSTFYFSY